MSAFSFRSLFGVGKKSDSSAELTTVDADYSDYDSPDKGILDKQLKSDELATLKDDQIEGQYVDGSMVSSQDYVIVDPATIREKIKHYRWMSGNFYIDDAVSKIVNEVIIEENNKIVSLDLNDVDLSENIKKKIHNEWDIILRKIRFNKYSSTRFEMLYIEGRSYYRMIFGDNVKDGIIGIQQLDSLHVEKYIENDKVFYKYTDLKGVDYAIAEESMIALNVGKTNADRNMYVSYLDQAIKPLNMLNTMVDAMAIYRITRAPERRVFNISTGRRTTTKAKLYVNDVINSLKSNLSFNSSTGKMSQSYKTLTMVEDFYFPKGNDDTGTTVEPLAGGQQLGEITDIEYLKLELLKSLKIPLSRNDGESTMSSVFGNNSSDIQKEENDFAKLTKKLRVHYADLILIPLRINLILKKVITLNDWDEIEDDIRLVWSSDSHVAELKFNEKLQARADTVGALEEYIGTVFSKSYISKNIWQLTDEEREDMQKEIEEELKDEKKDESEPDKDDE